MSAYEFLVFIFVCFEVMGLTSLNRTIDRLQGQWFKLGRGIMSSNQTVHPSGLARLVAIGRHVIEYSCSTAGTRHMQPMVK